MTTTKKPLLIITATHKRNQKKATIYMYSVEQAKFFNKDFENFVAVGFADNE